MTAVKMTAFKKAVSAKPGKGSNSPMNDLLECPVCMTVMDPPIHQCSNGYAICFTCKTKVNNVCPICREEFGNIRCLALEKVAERLEFPCKFHLSGCGDILSYNNRLKHEKICSFRPYICPYIRNCPVTGDIRCRVTHLKETHGVSYVDGDTFNHFCKISHDKEKKWKPSVCFFSGHQFCMHFEVFVLGIVPVFMAFMRYMGNKNEADKFRYSIEVGGHERKMTWQGIPRSIRDNDMTVRDSYDGLIIQKHLAIYFSGEGLESKLKVATRIWRV